MAAWGCGWRNLRAYPSLHQLVRSEEARFNVMQLRKQNTKVFFKPSNQWLAVGPMNGLQLMYSRIFETVLPARKKIVCNVRQKNNPAIYNDPVISPPSCCGTLLDPCLLEVGFDFISGPWLRWGQVGVRIAFWVPKGSSGHDRCLGYECILRSYYSLSLIHI